MFFFKIIGKFIGIILVVVGAATIIGMFIGMLTMGTLDWINLPGVDGVLNNLTVAPVWVFSILLFFAIGIPFFFLMYLTAVMSRTVYTFLITGVAPIHFYLSWCNFYYFFSCVKLRRSCGIF